jgi:hypothetical protein
VKTAAAAMTIVSMVLAASIIVMYFNLTALIQQQSNQIDELEKDIQGLKDALMSQLNYDWHNVLLTEEIKLNATAQRIYFSSLIDTWLSLSDLGTTKTVMVHFSEKGDGSDVHCPYPHYAYELCKQRFAGKSVWVIPEYEGNMNLNARVEMLAQNYTGILICIDAFEGGNNASRPNVRLNIRDLEQIMSVADVRAIRFPEVISWYMLANDTNTEPLPFPKEWIHEMLDFALSKGLKIYWSEWKLGTDIEEITKETLAGYEDNITYLYQTNNPWEIPLIGNCYAHEFQHWGASVQSWYKVHPNDTEERDDLDIDIVAEYAKLARNMGAETIQFEPYWYFFDNSSEPKETMEKMWELI